MENVLKKISKKTVIIIKGGPGTGKSVVAIQLLCDLIKKNYMDTMYIIGATKTTKLILY